MDEFDKRLTELATDMWKTSGARFLAASRLARREKLSTFTIALLSVITTLVGLLEPHSRLAGSGLGLSTAVLTAAMALIILVVSLIEGGSQNAVRSYKLHENAMCIAEIRHRLEDLRARANSEKAQHWNKFEELRLAYDTSLRECPFNHETIDYERFVVQHRCSEEFALNGKPRLNWANAVQIKVGYFFSSALLSVASWFAIMVLVYFAV
jgi:hypothetical protein